jgi:hypothetical protein
VVLAVASTGSAKPWEWTRTDPSLAMSRYQACAQQGLGAIGCMLSSGFHPASAAAGPARSQDQPLFSVATIQDPMPSPAPSHGPAARPPVRNLPVGASRPGSGVGPNPAGPGLGPGGPDPSPRPSAHPTAPPGGPTPIPSGPPPTPEPGP